MRTMHLFAGAGGGLLADLILGHQPVVAVEWDAYACAVLQERRDEGWFPGLYVREGDIRMFDPSEWKGRVDCIHAGFPCQDISAAGKGAGITGERSGLFSEVLRAIDVVRPAYVFLENSPLIVTRGLDHVLRSLAERGYDAVWTILAAADVGAPHLRKRWWCLAWRADATGEQLREQGGSGTTGFCGEVPDAVLAWERWKPREEKIKGMSLPNTDEIGRAGRAGMLGQVGRSESSVEPDVGRAFDGLAGWLDGFDMMIPHELVLTYGVEKNRAFEDLRFLRDYLEKEALQRTSGGYGIISPEEVLLAYVRQLEKRWSDEAWKQLEGKKAPRWMLRVLRSVNKSERSPRRPESEQQSAGKHTDALQTLPRLLARHAEKAWLEYRRKNATRRGKNPWAQGWEDGITRVAHGVAARVDRIRCLGNGQVPLCAAVAFKMLWEEMSRETGNTETQD